MATDGLMMDLLAHVPWHFDRPKTRYMGTGVSWSYERLAPADKASIRSLYDAMTQLMALPIWELEDTRAQREAVLKWREAVNWNGCWRNIAALGPETYALIGSDAQLRRVIHDLRGGPMTSLVLCIARLQNDSSLDPQYIWLLARDVLKIARNCFPDLDPERYQADVAEKGHSVRLLGEKWSKVKNPTPVEVTMNFDGHIANSCIEFSALDRVIYNVMNNALRESVPTDAPVELKVLAESGHEQTEDVRFWIANQISQAQYDEITHRFGDDLSDLFLTGYSTTGSGVGLQIVAEFVGNAYGLTPARAVEKQVLGAYAGKGVFGVWFHWPAVD